MTNRLQSDESFTLGVRRLLLRAIDALAHETRVHQARTTCKQIRAWLRLIEDAMGKDAYAQENMTFRNIARRFRGARDAETLRETLIGLREEVPDRIDVSIADALMRAIVEHHPVPANDVLGQAFALGHRDAVAARNRITVMTLEDEPVKAAFARSWRRNRRAWRQARDRDTEALHDWRKDVKYLRNQVKIMRDAWPVKLDGMDDDLKKLAGRLGADHDLAALERAVRELDDGDRVPAGMVLPVITERRETLQDEAMDIADGLYDRKAGRFGEIISRHWLKWRQ